MTDQMAEQQMKQIMIAAANMVCDELTDSELAGVGMVGLLGSDPRAKRWYEKAKPLFTEQNGTRMHEVTREAVSRIIDARLGGGV